MRLQRTACTLLAVCLCLIPLSACRKAEAPGGLTHVRFQTDWYPQPEHGGFYTALVKGYYKQEGLDVEFIPGGPYVSADAQLASGSIQFAMSSADKVLESIANAQEPLLAIGATMQHDPQGVMVHAESPVKNWPDLEGHTVAVKPGSTWWEFILKRYNLQHVSEIPLTFSVANFLKDPNYIQQGFLTSEPYFAQKAGSPARFLLDRDAGFDPYRVFITSQGYAKAHPEIVAKFTRASIRGWKEYMRDPAPANATILKLNPALNPEWMAYSYQALKDGHFITGDGPTDQTGQLDPARWTALYQQLTDLKVIQNPIDPNTAYTTQYLK